MDVLPDSPPKKVQKVEFNVSTCVLKLFARLHLVRLLEFLLRTCDNMECRQKAHDLHIDLELVSASRGV